MPAPFRPSDLTRHRPMPQRSLPPCCLPPIGDALHWEYPCRPSRSMRSPRGAWVDGFGYWQGPHGLADRVHLQTGEEPAIDQQDDAPVAIAVADVRRYWRR